MVTSSAQNLGQARNIISGRDSFLALGDQYLRIDPLPLVEATASTAERDSRYDRNRPIFIQYLNPEIRRCYRREYRPRTASRDLTEALNATRLSVLATDNSLIIPASYLFEVPILPQWLAEVRSLREAGHIEYTSHISDPVAYSEHKSVEYRNDTTNPYSKKTRRALTGDLLWRPRYASSAAEFIAADWLRQLEPGGQLDGTLKSLSRRWPTENEDAETVMRNVPERLEGQAFIARFVQGRLPVEMIPDERSRIDFFLSQSYLSSYLTDLDAAMLIDFSFGRLSCGVDQIPQLRSRTLSARRLTKFLRNLDILDFVLEGATWHDLIALRQSPETGLALDAVFDSGSEYQLQAALVRSKKRFRPGIAETMTTTAGRIAILAEKLLAAESFGSTMSTIGTRNSSPTKG